MGKNDAIEHYDSIMPVYTKLGEKVNTLLMEVLELSNINIHASSYRLKTKSSFERKAKLKGYKNPSADITDILGVRVIAYVEDDVVKICSLIREIFDVDELRSVNKNDELGEDRVGYRSYHFICNLKADRLKLPEYKKFDGLYFEIQVRTILQHSWAECVFQ